MPVTLPPTGSTVTFCDEDGSLLEEQRVAKGGTAVYSGTTPTTNYDGASHYTFAGWVDEQGNAADLGSISADLTVYASFTATAHSYTETLVTPSTCSGQGQKAFSCSCGYSYLEDLPFADHTPETIPAVPATCTQSGMTEGSKCSVCGGILVAPVESPATGHSSEIIPGIPATCTTSGLSDGAKCSVCGITLTQQEILPRLGHDMEYTDLGENHMAQCNRCNKTQTEAHTFTSGSCICGAEEEKESVEDASLKLNHTLNLAGDITLNYAIPAYLLEGFDMDTVEVAVTLPVYEGNTLVGERTLALEPELREYFYYFPLTGMTAVQMNDSVSAVLRGTKNGQTYRSPVDTYSIATYAYGQLDKVDVAQSLKTLCAELLRYGSKAQIFKGYRTDALVDSAMTEVQRAYLSDLDAVIFGNTNRTLNDLENAPITWAGKALNLESKVALKFVFNPGNYTGNLSDLTLRVSYKDAYGADKNLTVTDPELYSQSGSAYAFTLDTLLAPELRTVVSAQIYAGNTPVSVTLQYSPDTYGNGKTGDLLTLCKSLFAYSDSAKAYFLTN